MKKLICITGMDGTGKTTLLKSLKKELPNIYIAGIWDLLENPVQGLPFKSKKDIDKFLCVLTPDSRLLFLAHAMKYSIDKAFESDSDLIIADSYYYKYFASELTLGAQENLVKAIIDSFPKPDLTIELYLTIQESALRKENFSRYECGLKEEKSIKTFINFQEKAKTHWTFFDKDNWHKLNARLKPEDVLSKALEIIKKL